jgi:hypothetical protein
MNMAVHTKSHNAGCPGANCLELGALNSQELHIFSTLIDHRLPLPIYLGDTWRCDVCIYESADITAMEAHIIASHEPEPMNNADWEEMLRDDSAANRPVPGGIGSLYASD